MGRHLQKNHKEILVSIIGIAVVFAIIFVVFILLPIGPGLSPPDIREYRFIPGSLHGPKLLNNRLSPISVEKITSPSAISSSPGEYLHAEYAVSGTAAKVSVDSWYFQERDDFLKATCELCNYLRVKGSIEVVDLPMKNPDNIEYDLQATRVSTDLFQGYFMVAERPFLSSSDDYFILYYGFMYDENAQYSDELILMSLISQAGFNKAREPLRGFDCERCR
jgi:hypothetical protein